MVLAKIVKRRQWEEGIRIGREQVRAEHEAEVRGWAKEHGISMEGLSYESVSEMRAVGRKVGRREGERDVKAWAKERGIWIDDLIYGENTIKILEAGREEGRRGYDAEIRAWAKRRGISLDGLFDDEDERG